MAEPRSLQIYGNNLLVLMDDGTRRLALASGGNFWVVGGNGAQTGPGPGPDPDPDPTPDPGDNYVFAQPFPFSCVSSEYGPRSGRIHQGIDFSTNGTGEAHPGAEIHAAYSGTVIRAETGHYNLDGSGFGNVVIINHGVIPGVSGVRFQQQVFTVYGHMEAPGAVVSVGQTVSKGQLLGRVGNTGNSYGAHLHWETHIASPGGNISWNNPGTHIDPRTFMERYS